MPITLKCAVCRKTPDELEEYQDQAKAEEMTPDEFVRENEGTFNPRVQLFCCTTCYIDIGMPSSNAGWKPSGFITPPKGA